MSMNDGGPAFPMPSGNEPRVNETTHYNEGMSLRDWFAGMAMQGIAMYERSQGTVYENLSVASLRDSAQMAYQLADAMLAERGKSQ